jgi:hypothetical protein
MFCVRNQLHANVAANISLQHQLYNDLRHAYEETLNNCFEIKKFRALMRAWKADGGYVENVSVISVWWGSGPPGWVSNATMWRRGTILGTWRRWTRRIVGQPGGRHP